MCADKSVEALVSLHDYHAIFSVQVHQNTLTGQFYQLVTNLGDCQIYRACCCFHLDTSTLAGRIDHHLGNTGRVGVAAECLMTEAGKIIAACYALAKSKQKRKPENPLGRIAPGQQMMQPRKNRS